MPEAIAASAAPRKKRRRPGPPVPANWQQKFLKRVARYGTIYRTAQACGVSADTVLRMRQSDPAFDHAVTQARERCGDRFEELLVKGFEAQLGKNPNPANLIVLLKALRPDLYIERRAIDIRSVNVDLKVSEADALELLRGLLTHAPPHALETLSPATVIDAVSEAVSDEPASETETP